MARRRTVVPDLLLAGALVAAELLLAARLLDTDTFFDEGVYLAAADALRHGQALGSDVFTAQPPGYYAFLEAAQALLGRGLEPMRLAHVVVVCAGVAAAYALGRLLSGRLAGFTAGAAMVIAYPLPLFAPRVLADPPAVALTIVALALAAAGGRTRRWAPALVAASGAALAAATLVKLYAPLALPALVLLLWAPPRVLLRRAAVFAAGAALPLVAALVAYRISLPELWDGAVSYHELARRFPLLDNPHELVEVLNTRIPSTWILAAAACVAAALLVRRRLRPELALWTWPPLGLALVLWHEPLLEHHLVTFTIPASLAAGLTLGRAATGLSGHRRHVAVAMLLVALAAGYAQAHRRAASEHRAEEPGIVWAAHELARATSPDELVVSDLPYAAYLADRRLPGELVDTARLRFATGSLTRAEVLRIIEERCVRAVAAGRVFTVLPGFTNRLEALFDTKRRRFGVVVYTRGRCVP
jgi:4-amino-4-deoxy-L-arabinose transferase-like glycosyltransferase